MTKPRNAQGRRQARRQGALLRMQMERERLSKMGTAKANARLETLDAEMNSLQAIIDEFSWHRTKQDRRLRHVDISR